MTGSNIYIHQNYFIKAGPTMEDKIWSELFPLLQLMTKVTKIFT